MANSARSTKAKLEVMARFDEHAPKFDLHRTAAGYRLRQRLVKSLIVKEYRSGAFALDEGCGTAEYTISLAQAGFEAVGGDFSNGMLVVARSKVKDLELAGKVHHIRLELTRLPFRSESFELVTCIGVLDLMPDFPRLLVEANRVLKHGCDFIACVDGLWSPHRLFRRFRHVFGDCGKSRGYISSPIVLKRMLTVSGFLVENLFGDVLLAQVFSGLLYEPKRRASADRILTTTQPIDRRIARLPLLRLLSEHYIIEARKK